MYVCKIVLTNIFLSAPDVDAALTERLGADAVALQVVSGRRGCHGVGRGAADGGEVAVGRQGQEVARVDIHLVFAQQCALRTPLVQVARVLERRGVGAVHVARVGVHIEAVGLAHGLNVALHRAGQRLANAATACGAHYLVGVDGHAAEVVFACQVREAGAHGHESAVERGGAVGGRQAERGVARLALQRLVAVHDEAAGRGFVVVAGGVQAEVASALRELAVEVGHVGVDGLDHLHGGGIDNAHRRLEVVALLQRIAARVGHEEVALIQGYAFGLVAHLAGSHYLVVAQVYLGHEALVEVAGAADGLTLVAVAGHIDVLPVAGQTAVVGYVLGSCHGQPLGGHELYDVRPVQGYGYEIVVNLDDVVGRVAQFGAVLVAEPLVAHDGAVLKVAQPAVVGLPNAFVQHDEFLLCAGGGGQQPDSQQADEGGVE